MKFFKTLLVTLIAFLLSGCYTQLQYSQTMKKITDEKKAEETQGYSWDGEEQAEAVPNDNRTEDEYSEYTDGDYIPVYYKDYEYADRYKECDCSPYNVYNFYGSDWYGYDSFYSYHRPWALSPYHYHRWYHPYHGFYHSRFAFSFSFGWGNYHRFYDPFYDPFYDYYYRYGFHRPYGSFGYFYGNSGYGHGVYNPDDEKRDQNVRYGPRGIGSDRVVENENRSRDRVRSKDGNTVTTSPTVRTRSSAGKAETVKRTRSQDSGNKSDTKRTRSRDDQQSSKADRVYIDRTRQAQPPVLVKDKDDQRTRAVRSRAVNRNGNSISNLSEVRSNLRNVEPPKPRVERSDKKRSIFFDRMKGFFQDNTTRIMRNNGSNSTIRSRSSSSSNRSSVKQSKSSNNRSSVNRSRSSSSSNSRSDGSSSSRSRSDDSGGSDRNRDR